MIDDVLIHLEKVRKAGADRYYACCPVHDDKDPSMLIDEKNGKVGIYCFVCGANGLSVIRKLGLSANVLFAGKFTGRDSNWKLKEHELFDKFFLEIYQNSDTKSDSDEKIYQEVIQREKQRSNTMANYDNNNRGAVWPNRKPQSDKSPTHTGKAVIDGVEYYVNAWRADPSNPKAPSLSFSFKKVEESGGKTIGGQQPDLTDVPF